MYVDKAVRVIVVGMNPSHKPILPGKQNPTLRNLEKWMNTLEVRHYSFINTFDFPGKAKMTNVNFISLIEACSGYSKVLALGNFASDALDKIGIDHFLLPHPSPLNRQLNDKKFEKQILSKCKDYLND